MRKTKTFKVFPPKKGRMKNPDEVQDQVTPLLHGIMRDQNFEFIYVGKEDELPAGWWQLSIPSEHEDAVKKLFEENKWGFVVVPMPTK